MLRCSPEAFAKCPTSHLCGSPHEATFVEGSECDEFNQQVLDKPMTNADRIRAMTDEQLAAFVYSATHINDRSFGLRGIPCCSHNGTLQWLKQPAEGD